MDGQSRRIGFVHGALNLTATGLFATSLVMRRRARGAGGRVCALLGYAVALGAAYLGGDLVYGEQAGVNHAAGQEVPEDFTPVLALNELGEQQPKRVTVGTTQVLLVRLGDDIRAIADRCSHLGGPLSEGTLKDGAIVCPWHGSCFALDDGHVVNGPATHRQPCFETRVRSGQIEIRMPRPQEHGASEEIKSAVTNSRAGVVGW
jgi:nitrite reductase/ring-hydroxylating ferredoxin subunit